MTAEAKPQEIGEAWKEVKRKDDEIDKALRALEVLWFERRQAIKDARELELVGLDPVALFRKRYHHAVENVRFAEIDVGHASNAHKQAKAGYEKALEDLTKLEDDENKAQAEGELPIIKQAEDGAQVVDAWKSQPLEVLGLSAAILAKLKMPVDKRNGKDLGEVATLGDLTDLMARTGLAYSQLKGISGTTSGKIEDAWMDFWQKNPAPAEPSLPEPIQTGQDKPKLEVPDHLAMANLEVICQENFEPGEVETLDGAIEHLREEMNIVNLGQLAHYLADDDNLDAEIGAAEAQALVSTCQKFLSQAHHPFELEPAVAEMHIGQISGLTATISDYLQEAGLKTLGQVLSAHAEGELPEMSAKNSAKLLKALKPYLPAEVSA